MQGTLTRNGQTDAATPEAITAAIAGSDFFWLDLDVHDPGPDDDVNAMFIDQFHFHPVAVEAADHFGQRPRIDDYDDFVHIVTFGMAGDGKHVAEVHCFLTEHSIISVHHGDCPALGSVRDKIGTHHAHGVGRAAGGRVLPDHGHADRLVLPGAVGLRRGHRSAGDRHPQDAHRGAAGHVVRHESARS